MVDAAHNFNANDHSGSHDIGISGCLVIQNRVDPLEGIISGYFNMFSLTHTFGNKELYSVSDTRFL